MISSQELLVNALQEWADLHSRKVTEKATEAWIKIFVNIKPQVLSKALTEVTKKAEKMPTPGMLTKAIQGVYDCFPDLVSDIELRFGDPACKICGGTGFETFKSGEHSKKAKRCKCWQDQAREYKTDFIFTHDKEGIPCAIDGKTEDVLYRAPDCVEGQEFLKYLRLLAKVKSVPKEKTTKQLKRERNRQIAALGMVP